MKKPIVTEVFACNGGHSHYVLIDSETGDKLWSEAPEECEAMGFPVMAPLKPITLEYLKELAEIAGKKERPFIIIKKGQTIGATMGLYGATTMKIEPTPDYLDFTKLKWTPPEPIEPSEIDNLSGKEKSVKRQRQEKKARRNFHNSKNKW